MCTTSMVKQKMKNEIEKLAAEYVLRQKSADTEADKYKYYVKWDFLLC